MSAASQGACYLPGWHIGVSMARMIWTTSVKAVLNAGKVTLRVPVGYTWAEMPDDAPPGAYDAWRNAAGDLAILGEPDPDDEEHSCDAMGCGQDHVLEFRRAAR